MSNGARLTALFVVVAVAAVGLYLAFMTPAKPQHADPLAPNGSLATPDREPDLGKITLGGTDGGAGGSGGPAIPGSGTTGGSTPGSGTTGGTGTPAPTNGAGSTPAGGAGGAPSPGAGSGVSPTGNNVVPIPLGSGGSGTNGGGAAQTAATTSYTVKSGDTLEGIARAQLGDGQKWRSIVELNPGLDPRTLKIGQTIKLPAATAAAGSKTETAKPAGEVGSAAGNTYTVQKGDTLVAISRKFYGSDGDWKRILEANASLLKGNASALQPGMKLAIPAKR